MKKFLSILAVLLMLCGPVFAEVVPVTTIIDGSTVIDADPTSLTSSVVTGTVGLQKTMFSVSYDETDANTSMSVAVTLEMSMDNSIWSAASFYDYAGGATLQTSETISATNKTAPYIFWISSELPAPYLRVKVTATGSDGSHTAIVIVKVAQK